MNGWTLTEFIIFVVFSLLFIFFLIFKVSKEQQNFDEKKLVNGIKELHDDVMNNIKTHVARHSTFSSDNVNNNQMKLQHQNEISGQRPILLSMKQDLLNCLDSDNVFGFYAQTVFKYDCDYIREMKENNKILFGFFFKRFVNSYHYILAMKNEKDCDEGIINVQLTLFLFYIQNTIFLTIVIRRLIPDMNQAILYSLIYNNAIVIPINLLVSKFMRNFTSIYRKMEFYFITEKKSIENEQLKKKHMFWNFCSYLVFIIFAIVAVNCVFFGQEIFNEDDYENDGQAIYSSLIVIGLDLLIGRFLFCFLFMIIKILSKFEKTKLLADAKEFLFFQHLLLQKDENHRKRQDQIKQTEKISIQESKPGEIDTETPMYGEQILFKKETVKNDKMPENQNISIRIHDNDNGPQDEIVDQINNEFDVATEGPIHKGDSEMRSTLKIGCQKVSRPRLSSATQAIKNPVLTQSIVDSQNRKISFSLSRYKHSSSNSKLVNMQSKEVKEFEEKSISSGRSSIKSEEKIVQMDINRIQNKFRLNELKQYENDTFLFQLQDLREAMKNPNQNIQNPNVTRDISIFKKTPTINYDQEVDLNLSNILNQSELNDIFPSNIIKRTETEYVQNDTGQHINQINVHDQNMKTVLEERDETNF